MNLERRILLASLLSLGILMLFSSLYKPPSSVSQPSHQKLVSKPSPSSVPTPPPLFLPPPESCSKGTDVVLGNFTITVCTTGGYVKKIVSNRYHDILLFHNLLYLPQFKDKMFKIVHSDHAISLIYEENGASLTKEISLGSNFAINLKINNQLNKVINKVLISSFAKDKGFYSRYEEFLFKNDTLVKRIPWSRVKSKHYSFLETAGFRSRYYAFILFNLRHIFLTREGNDVYFISEEPLKPQTIWAERGFLGPQSFSSLAFFNLKWIVNYGLFNPIAIMTLKALNFSHHFFKNWGLSIIVLSVLIYLALFPLSAAGFKSMSKMQALQPKIEALKLKYKDDPQKLNRATLELYKKEGVNPLGGCLPMLLQIPVFFAFYQALIRSVEIKGAHFLWIRDLSKPDYFIKLPYSLPLIGNGIHLLPIIMALIMFFQQRLTARKGGTVSEQQKTMAMIIPLIFGFIFYNFPSGLVLYWLINNLLGFFYQYKITRQVTL